MIHQYWFKLYLSYAIMAFTGWRKNSCLKGLKTCLKEFMSAIENLASFPTDDKVVDLKQGRGIDWCIVYKCVYTWYTHNIHIVYKCVVVVSHTFNLSTEFRGKQLSEIEGILVYRMDSRKSRATQRNSSSKNQTNPNQAN